jgi:uncharacterized protein
MTDEERTERVAPGLVYLVLSVVGVALLLIPAFLGKWLYVDWLWFASVGYEAVYVRMLGAQIGLFVASTVLAAAVLIPCLLLARRLAAQRWLSWERQAVEMGIAADDEPEEDRRRPRDITPVALVISVLAALLLGWWASAQWDIILRLGHQTPFGQTEPLFGLDVAYFVFTLPVLQLLRTWLFWVLGLALVLSAAVYFARLVLPQAQGEGFRLDEETQERRVSLAFGTPIRAHLSLLGALVFALLAWDQRLRMYELAYSTRGTTFGAGYADIHALWPALWLLLFVAAVSAAALLVGMAVRGPWIGIGATATFFAVSIVGTMAYPAVVQRLQVAPNELQMERPFIERNIEMSRRAYGLDRVQESPFAVADAVSRVEVEANPATMRNIRLWDYEPLLATYNQIQSIRGYYDFLDADFDRYVIDGEYRQVMIAARELSPHKLPADAQTWVNRRLQFTHGYGVVVSPVNEVTPEGLPTLFVQDVPPRGKIPVTQPEIYYGESRADWVVVKTKVPEFDYPRGSDNVEVIYQGNSGVGIGSFFRRLLFAWEFSDFNLILTPALTPESHVLFHRNISQRVRKVAPFLLYDADPYLVISNGRLVWIYDAYTISAHYPYAQPASPAFNYLRNSVKITIDAYDGSMAFYVADADDPLIRAYAGIFPGMFRPLSEMPPGLQAHIRYPGNLFAVQSQMYRLYHIQDARVFYQREDLLNIPAELYLGQQRPVPVRPYYAIMRLPGEAREEFVYILPYTPPGKDNMITWLAARSDGANYGKLVAYKYPKDTLIFGPMQVEARIDQDPTISAQFTLWNQGGSRVLRGNMLAIPIGQSNLYVEPIYLQAERSRLPEMKRVIVATGNRLAMGLNVEDALSQLYDGPISFGPTLGAPATAAAPSAPAAPVAQAPSAGPAGAPAPAPAPAAVPPATTGAAGAPSTPSGAVDRQALAETIRSLQRRYERVQEDTAGIQSDLQRLLQALEAGP